MGRLYFRLEPMVGELLTGWPPRRSHPVLGHVPVASDPSGYCNVPAKIMSCLVMTLLALAAVRPLTAFACL